MGRKVPRRSCEQKSAVTSVVSVTVKPVMRLMLVWLVVGCAFEQGRHATDENELVADSGVVVDVDAAISDGPTVTPVIDAPCADDDSDGVCNSADDWPCGAKPADPGAMLMFSGNNGATNTTVSAVNLDGTGRYAVAASNEMMALTLSYSINDTACQTACVDQLEIGWVPGRREACVFDAAVPKATGVSGTVTVNIRAPMTKQVYDLRVNLGQNFSCNSNGANNWWGGTPASTRTIAKLCVH
jgi:hypothetical protein